MTANGVLAGGSEGRPRAKTLEDEVAKVSAIVPFHVAFVRYGNVSETGRLQPAIDATDGRLCASLSIPRLQRVLWPVRCAGIRRAAPRSAFAYGVTANEGHHATTRFLDSGHVARDETPLRRQSSRPAVVQYSTALHCSSLLFQDRRGEPRP